MRILWKSKERSPQCQKQQIKRYTSQWPLMLLKSVWHPLKKFGNGQEARLKNRKLLIIEPWNRKKTVFSARKSLDQAKTGNVIAVNIRKFAIKALFVTDAALKLQKQVYVVNVWDISSLQLRYPISGTSRESHPEWGWFLTFHQGLWKKFCILQATSFLMQEKQSFSINRYWQKKSIRKLVQNMVILHSV